jgi:hypothetical protein
MNEKIISLLKEHLEEKAPDDQSSIDTKHSMGNFTAMLQTVQKDVVSVFEREVKCERKKERKKKKKKVFSHVQGL